MPLITPQGFIHAEYLSQLVNEPENSVLRKLHFNNAFSMNTVATNDSMQVPNEASSSKIRKRRFVSAKARSEPSKKPKSESGDDTSGMKNNDNSQAEADLAQPRRSP